MTCPTCTANAAYRINPQKAKVVKTQNHGETTHRIYRCTYVGCGETFHAIEIPRERHRNLETLERSVRDFADRFHR